MKSWKFLNCLFLLCAFLSISTLAYANGDRSLIVSYVTFQLNHLPDAVQGVLVSPSGNVLKTGALGPFGSQKIVVDHPEEGTYSAYYQAIIDIKPKYCYIVGGVDAHLSNEPSLLIPFTPTESHIQGFTQSQTIRIGDTTLPIASFEVHAS